MAFQDIEYSVESGLATITINREDRLNAFRAETVDELIKAFKMAWSDENVGVACLTGAGSKAFCVGGDQKQRAETGSYGESETGIFEIMGLQKVIRDIPKPVIAAVNGLAIGGGHVLHVLCDLSIAADTARFGQNGPRVGSFDAGFGTGVLARCVGEKRAKEIWFMCRQYDAETAERWGLVNAVVPAAELHAEVRKFADEILVMSPSALRFLKQSFNIDTEQFGGYANLANTGLLNFVETPEAKEGLVAFAEKRPTNFGAYRKRVSQ